MPAETPPYGNRDRARLLREIPFQAEPAFRDPQLGLVSAIDQPRSCQLENAAVKKDDCPKAGPRQFQTCEAPSRTAAYKNRLFPRRQSVAEPNRSCLHARRDKPGSWRQSLPFAALRGHQKPTITACLRPYSTAGANTTAGKSQRKATEGVFGASLREYPSHDSKPVSSRRRAVPQSLSSEVHRCPAFARQLLELVVVSPVAEKGVPPHFVMSVVRRISDIPAYRSASRQLWHGMCVPSDNPAPPRIRRNQPPSSPNPQSCRLIARPPHAAVTCSR